MTRLIAHKLKTVVALVAMLPGYACFGQSAEEVNLLTLSNKVFHWEVTNQVDSLEMVFDDRFVVIDGQGTSQTKQQYIPLLRSGKFVHESVDVEENTATVVGNTGTVVGKGRFVVTIPGSKIDVRLSYIEVFTRSTPSAPWKILAMHATQLPAR